MAQTQNLRVRNAHTLHSPEPTLPCGYCERSFTNLSGRNRHRKKAHRDAASLDVPPMAPEVLPEPAFDFAASSTPPTSSAGSSPPLSPNNAHNMDVDRPQNHLDLPEMDVDLPDFMDPGFNFNFGPDHIDASRSPSNRDTPLSQREDTPTDFTPPRANSEHIGDQPRVTRQYHRELNGK